MENENEVILLEEEAEELEEEELGEVEHEDNDDPQPKDEKPKQDDDSVRLSKEEYAALRERLARLESQNEKPDEEEEVEKLEHPLSYLDDEEQLDALLEDPSKIREAFNKQGEFFVKLLKQQTAAFFEEIDRRDPRRQEEEPVIERLKKSEKFKGFSENEIRKMVRSGVIKLKKEERVNDEEEFSGSPGSGSRRRSKGKEKVDPRVEEFERRLGYDRI